MKTSLIKIFAFAITIFTLNSCTKVGIQNPIYGYYVSANNNSPFGSTIQLYDDNVAEIRVNGTFIEEAFTYDANTIYFNNGNVAYFYNNNELEFEQQVEYLNPEYYDGNNDGYDDWDYTTPHYIWETHRYSYFKK